MVTQPSRETPAFELTSFRCTYGRIVVEGRWSGVRGLRFVRPTLILGGRELLATLDHKPWAPEARIWRAAFRWDGPEPQAQDAALAVTPSLVLPLVAGGEVPRTLPREVSSSRMPEAAVSAVRTAAATPAAPRDPALEPAPTARPAPALAPASAARPAPFPVESAPPPPQPGEDMQRLLRQERDDAAAREHAALATAERDHERALSAVRSEHAEALEDQGAELERARTETETARRERDDALVAHRALQRHVDGLRESPCAAEPALGLPSVKRPGRAPPSQFDRWAFRTVGVITAGSFLLLLWLLLRVFI